MKQYEYDCFYLAAIIQRESFSTHTRPQVEHHKALLNSLHKHDEQDCPVFMHRILIYRLFLVVVSEPSVNQHTLTHPDSNTNFQLLPSKHASFIRPHHKAMHLHRCPRPSLELQTLLLHTNDLIM